MGGGITSINAEELSSICNSATSRCEIKGSHPLITNRGDFNLKTSSGYDNGIYIQTKVTSFINYGTITTYKYSNGLSKFSIDFQQGNGIDRLTNYGTISGGISGASGSNTTITNYGVMGGLCQSGTTGSARNIIINNYGEIKPLDDSNGKKYHFNGVHLTLQNYALKITQNPTTFNSFDGNNATDNSHLILESVNSVNFADKNSKVILDFGSGFEFGAGYDLNKLIVNTDGANALSVDFDRLMPKNDIYTLIQSGEYFIAKLTPQHSAISNISKSNIRTMNNFYTMSNSMIFPRKVYHSQNLRILSLRDLPTANRGNPLIKESLDSAIHLKSYESFSYRNESINRRIQRQNKRNYSRQPRTSSQNQTQNLKESQSTLQTQTFSQNLAQNINDSQTPHNYYFILTPFVNHNLFFESGRYNLSGLEYGFLTAFSGLLTPSNSLGAHFMMSYGSLGDSKDKDFNIKSLNLNIGLNYKFDMIWDMYLKARGDFFYFLNQVKTLTMLEAIKPNNLGFGVSLIFGKDFNFGKGGMLGIEAGIDYKVLKTSTISLQNNATKTISETYQKALYNLIYVDLGMSYNKYFGGFGINLGTGFKANLAPKLAESALLLNSQTLKFTLDNDKYLAYANAGISYLLNHKNFDMEFSLAYYGNFGDRVISNGGGFEFRVVF